MKNKAKILIVDDEPINLEFFDVMLSRLGFIVEKAEDGEEALEKVQECEPDLIILDMTMPKMNGYEVIGRLKEDVMTKDIPILVLTGLNIEMNELKEINRTKAIPIMQKPVDDFTFRKWVDYLL